VYNTHDEAVAVATLVRRQRWKKIVLVTSPIHSRRTELVFRKAVEDIGVEVLSRPCRETTYDFENLQNPPDRLQVFGEAIHEHTGIFVYRLRGWIV
jgi:uncharacterized SAM-binding protein YcdF (DUF218 family)